LDAAPVIYLVENAQPLAAAVEAYIARPGSELVSTELTRLECCVKPMRDTNATVLRQFERFFSRTVHESVPLSRDVMDRATEVRARYGFATPDSIHLAAALVAGCDVSLTNDHRLSRAVGIQVEVI
jgi:predicted nucleic acid-binding protein